MQPKRPMQTPEMREQAPKFRTKEEFLEYRRRVLLAKKEKRRKKAEQRKRVILGVSAVILAILLIAILVLAISRRGEHTPNETDSAPVNAFQSSDDTSANGDDVATTAMPSEGNTEPQTTATLETESLYEGENIVAAEPIVPHRTEQTLTLSSELICPYMILLRAKNGEILCEKVSNTVIFPASMTKLMTVLVAYEQNKDLSKTYEITQTMIDPLYLDGLALAGFKDGEEITLHDLLYASALPSAAEASMGLALATAGSEEAFVALMNDRAATLGMTHTHFENCTGTHHPDHVSSVGDIAILLSYILNDPFLSEMLSTKTYTTAPTPEHPEGISLSSTVFSYMKGDESGTCTVLGGKTGYTIPAGRCLATAAKHNVSGEIFICVIAGGAERRDPVNDTVLLYQSYIEP